MNKNTNDDIRNLLYKLDSADKPVLKESKVSKAAYSKKSKHKESKKFDDYLKESERQAMAPVTGDIVNFIVNEELCIEAAVTSHDDSSYTISIDDITENVLSSCGCEILESEYQGRDVELNKPMRGDVKAYKVYVTDPKTGNVRKINFGDKNMRNNRDDPEARRNFRARHQCDKKSFEKDRTTAGYWSCRFWSSTPVSELLN